MSGSGISWAVCKSAPRSREITMPAPHNSVFHRPDALPAAQSAASKHWRQIVLRPTRHNMGHFGDVSTSQSLGLVGKVTKPNTTQARIRQSKEMYYNKKINTNKKLSYRRGTARCIVSVEILPIATQQCRNFVRQVLNHVLAVAN